LAFQQLPPAIHGSVKRSVFTSKREVGSPGGGADAVLPQEGRVLPQEGLVLLLFAAAVAVVDAR